MRKLYIIILSFIIGSCSVSRETVASNTSTTQKKKESNKETQINTINIPVHNVHILIRSQIPYCGGASPTDAQMNNSSSYSEEIVLINHKDSSRTVISPFQNGSYYLTLLPGNYSIQEAYKNVPYHQFRSNLQSNYSQYIVYGGEDCYKKWWENTLKDFTVSDSVQVLTVNAFISVGCYTGINPCDYYNGPYPP